MKKIFSVALIALFFTLSANAQLFWKVSGNGLSKPSYLFGTHHLIEKEKIAGFDKILAVLSQTDAVVGEMDMSDMLGMQIKVMQAAIMKDTLVQNLMSPEDYSLVNTQFKQVVGMGLDKLGKMKPMMLSTLYEAKLYMKQNNLKKEPEAVDIVFQKAGKKNKKKIIGLETVEQQMDILFNSMSLKRQAEMLVQSVKDTDKSTELLKKLNEAYLKGDLKAMSDLNSGDNQMTPAEKKILIENRNNDWIIQLNTIMPDRSCFIAVGCLHLVDEIGLIQQLKKEGFTVEPVTDL